MQESMDDVNVNDAPWTCATILNQSARSGSRGPREPGRVLLSWHHSEEREAGSSGKRSYHMRELSGTQVTSSLMFITRVVC